MGRNESTVELLVKVWEGIREFLEVPKESTGSLFRHMRVTHCKSANQEKDKLEPLRYLLYEKLRMFPPNHNSRILSDALHFHGFFPPF